MKLQGNSRLAGGAVAVIGEVAADIIRKQLYGKEVKDLTEAEKETISALSQLASGLAVAAGGGNIGDASAAISSSKNAVENNYVGVGLAIVKAAEAMPAAGLGMSVAELAKSLSKAQLKELSALMAMEKSGELTPGLAKKLKEFLSTTQGTENISKNISKTTGYIKQGDNIVGPRGGVYTNTGQVDAAGNPIYKNNGSYYIFEKNEKIKVPSPGNTGTTTNGRPTPVDSERDVGKTLTPDFNAQESYLNGQKVKWGTDGSVRPDFCNGTTCSIEVKNYDIQNNINGLIDNVSKQAIERKKHLPSGVQQLVVIDIRGQKITAAQQFKIKQGIKNKSNGIIKPEQIRLLTD